MDHICQITETILIFQQLFGGDFSSDCTDLPTSTKNDKLLMTGTYTLRNLYIFHVSEKKNSVTFDQN